MKRILRSSEDENQQFYVTASRKQGAVFFVGFALK